MSNTTIPVSPTATEAAKSVAPVSAPATAASTTSGSATLPTPLEVPATQLKKETATFPVASSKSDIENHKLAAIHHTEAAKYHLEAAKHHEEGNHEKAAATTIKANGHSILAQDCQKEDVRQHATQN